MYMQASLKKKGVQKNQGASMGACLIEELRNDLQFGLTMQECTTNIMSTHDYTDVLNILM